MRKDKTIVIQMVGWKPILLKTVVCDFTGTISLDGKLLPGIGPRLRRLARRVRIVVATADTGGTARQRLARLPVEVSIIRTGYDKMRIVEKLGAAHVVAIGNGRNDVAMVCKAALGIAVIGFEGAAGDLLRVADVIVPDVRAALDLLLKPLRAKATLRG